jgi:hypothetical protein
MTLYLCTHVLPQHVVQLLSFIGLAGHRPEELGRQILDT